MNSYMQPQVPADQPYTILRIKRKRNEEPLEALVVETAMPRKRSRGRMGMFQFAQTVEPKAWEDEAQRLILQEEIQRLARENYAKAASEPPQAEAAATPPQASRPTVNDSRRYTVINSTEDSERPRLPTHPPAVRSHKDIPSPTKPNIKMYDAVPSSETTEADPEMDKFLPMIQAYLKRQCTPPRFTVVPDAQLFTVHDINPADELRKEGGQESGSDSDDYVWDVFYHRPATLSEWNHAAANVGTLTGLPPSAVDLDDSDSDDEVLDEADEDSNAEEYYKNDYPDEESVDSDSSDYFHESSDYEDMRRDSNDLDWR